MIRHKTYSVKIGEVILGGENNIVIQSMTDTDTADVEKTVAQVIALAKAGSEIVRVTVDTTKAARAVPKIKDLLLQKGCNVPLVGCFHYNGNVLLTEVPECAEALDKYRINPGNVGFGSKRSKNFETLVKIAMKYNKPIRIGVNWGSLDQDILAKVMDEAANKKLDSDDVIVEAMAASALNSAQHAVEIGLPPNMIVLSAKVSRLDLLKRIYVELAAHSNYALHLGLTEAGMGTQGIVSTTAALTSILQLGIGDTIRASITPSPGEPRTNEVLLCKEVLQSLKLRSFAPSVVSCPGCGRTQSDQFKQLALETNQFIQTLIANSNYVGIEKLRIAVMGCIVNGPGESKHADIGISLPGKGEEEVAVVFIDGEKKYTLRSNINDKFREILVEYIEERFSPGKDGAHGQT